MNLFRFLPENWKERLRRKAGAVTFRGRLENLHRAGFAPRRVIDAGAFRGQWTQMAQAIFPEAAFLLIEPQPALKEHLEKICRSLPSARLRMAALGGEPGEATFLLEASNSRILPAAHQPAAGEDILKVKIERLEDIAREEGFEECDFLKLDLQGHELEALAGAGALLGRAEVILAEVSWIPIGDVPLAVEIIQTLSARGYRLYDVMGFNYRPRDGALWQSDFLFVRDDSPLVASREWA